MKGKTNWFTSAKFGICLEDVTFKKESARNCEEADSVIQRMLKYGAKYLSFHFRAFEEQSLSVNMLKAYADSCKNQRLPFCVDYSIPKSLTMNDNLSPYVLKSNLETFFINCDVSMIRFSGAYNLSKNVSRDIAEYVKTMAPECLLGGDLGYQLTDVYEISDGQIPLLPCQRLWETQMRLPKSDRYFLDEAGGNCSSLVIHTLSDVVSKGGNLLLRLPKDNNASSKQSATLSKIGSWLREYGECIFSVSEYVTFPYENRWGSVTRAENRLFLIVDDLRSIAEQHGEIKIRNFATKVTSVKIMGTDCSLNFNQTYETARDEYRLFIYTPDPCELPNNSMATVLILEIEGALKIQSLYHVLEEDYELNNQGIDLSYYKIM